MIAFRVTGVVQGVGFRSGTARLATVTGLRGWVRNVGDGSVQGRISGTAEQIGTFFARLPTVSHRAVILGVQRREVDEIEEADGFEVLGTIAAPTADWR